MKIALSDRHGWTVSILLVCTMVMAWLVSRAALTGPFLFDDFPNFKNLEQIAGSFCGDRLARYLAAFADTPGRPLSALSFLIDDYAWPSTPYSWKRHNLLLHLLCGVLVFGFVRVLARARHSHRTADWVALGVAATWLLHPMQLSTSMLTVQRMTQLMTIATLATCWWAAHRLSTRPATAWECARLIVVGAVMTLVAFLFKENGALLPLYLAATSAWILRDKAPANPWAVRAYYIALLLPVAAICIVLLRGALAYQPDGIRDFDPWERLLTEGRILWDYLRQILLPRLDGSGIFHDDIEVSRSFLSPPSTLFAWVTIFGLLVLAVAKRRTWPLLAFAIAWFFGGHLMESTIWPLELYFEHRNYLPMVGVLAAISMALPSITSVVLRRSALFAALAWLCMCTAMTSVSSPIWGSQHALAKIWTREHPNSLRAVEILAKDQFENGDRDAARRTLMEAIGRNPANGNLAAQVLLVDCHAGVLDAGDFDWAEGKLAQGNFSRSALEGLAMLRGLIADGTCNPSGARDGEVRLIRLLSVDPDYQNAAVRSYLHVELVRDALDRRDYNDVVMNLKAAYAAVPNAKLAGSLAAILAEGGYLDEAHMWRQRSLSTSADWPLPWWEWLKRRLGYKPPPCRPAP